MIRRSVFYSGRVQGVGFRYTACQVAARFPVCGFVRNLSDGRVELVVEGEPESLNSFLDAVRSEFADQIRGVSESDQTPTGEFREFSIRH